jgi:hypothetical protein
MKTFEYKVEKMPGRATLKDVEEVLNAYGKDGWELCSTEYGAFMLKREVIKTGRQLL